MMSDNRMVLYKRKGCGIRYKDTEEEFRKLPRDIQYLHLRSARRAVLRWIAKNTQAKQ
jgi:hypothetical protein